MRRAIEEMGVSCWVTGLRCTEGRTRTDYLELEERDEGLLKLNPILPWHEREVWQYIALDQVPVNPLYGEGYRSLGCEPCTHITTGANERDGRWIGTSKCGGECGIHTRPLKVDRSRHERDGRELTAAGATVVAPGGPAGRRAFASGRAPSASAAATAGGWRAAAGLVLVGGRLQRPSALTSIPYLSLTGLLIGFLVGLTGMGGGALMTPDPHLLLRLQARRSRSAPTSPTEPSRRRSAPGGTGASARSTCRSSL